MKMFQRQTASTVALRSPPSSRAIARSVLAPGWWPATIMITLAGLVLGVVFARDVSGAVRVWMSSTAYNHCFLILPLIAFLLICGAWIFVAGYTSINAIVKAELFPTNVRALGVGLPYAITVSVFGGTAPAVALYFKSLGHEDWFYYYLSGMIFLSLLIYSSMRDTKHESAMHRHE